MRRADHKIIIEAYKTLTALLLSALYESGNYRANLHQCEKEALLRACKNLRSDILPFARIMRAYDAIKVYRTDASIRDDWEAQDAQAWKKEKAEDSELFLASALGLDYPGWAKSERA